MGAILHSTPTRTYHTSHHHASHRTLPLQGRHLLGRRRSPSDHRLRPLRRLPAPVGLDYSLVAVVPKDKLTVNGPVKKYSSKGSSGKDVHRLFCSECGSPIAHDPDAAPEIIALKAGTFDSELK